MATPGKCLACILTPIIVVTISISRAWAIQQQQQPHLSSDIQQLHGIKSLCKSPIYTFNQVKIIKSCRYIYGDWFHKEIILLLWKCKGEAFDCITEKQF